MKNLVLGSSGFLGKYLCEFLKNKGEEVVEFDIVKDIKQDCRTAKLPLEGIDRVYFLAWQVGGSNYLYAKNTQEEQLIWNNAILNNCMDQLKNTNFVFISSQLAESNDTIYGTLKKLGEHWTELNGGVSVRLWNIYGAYEEHSVKSHVVADFIHQAINNGKIEMQTTGDEVRQFIHVEDVCDALYNSFNKTGVFDASSLQWTEVYSIASLIAKEVGIKPPIKGKKIGSSLLIKNKSLVPGCKTKISLEEGIKQTVNLFKGRK